MQTLTIVLLLAVLAGTIALHYRLRSVHWLALQIDGAQQRLDANLFRQLEALLALHLELDLRQGLPALRGWAASPDFLLQLARHARQAGVRTVVECSSGASTLVLARCLQLNGGGKVYSLEHDPAYAARTRQELARLGLQDFAEVLDAPLRPAQLGGASWLWYDLAALPDGLAIDLLAIDGPPMATGPLARYPAGPALFGRLAPQGAVFLDDAARAPEQAILARWRAEFPQLSQDSRDCEKGCAVLRAA